jgi:transcriptional regulator with XRE-family HTH domain
MISFSDRLKSLLEQKQLTLAEVARSVGTSTPSVHRWTRGGRIEYENLRLLAKFLDVNWIWLRYGDEALEGLQESLVTNASVADERRKFLGEIVENEARMNLAQELAGIVTWEWNVLTDELVFQPRSCAASMA